MPCEGRGVRTVRDGAQPCAKSGSRECAGGSSRTVADGPSRTIPAHYTRTLTSHHSLGAPRWRRNPLGGWQPSTVPRKIEYADAANVDGAPDDGPFATG